MKYFLTCLIFILCFEGYSQNTEKDDVKIGLVLSGGGAKGLAHIGVLKVIDSLGVKIDYVAGTSMGAIIGSLYASGYTGKQLDSIFNEIDFDTLINDDLPRASKAFYERDNSEKYAVTLPFENFKIKLPSALSRGQNTYALFSKLTLHVSEINDFSKLPIPFFCIATDIETGQAVMLDSGNLAQSIMASGALPTLFQPVIIDGQMLIDGGVVNNYPIDGLRAKGMDIIIGVDVQDGLASREELTSAPDVLVQINNFRTINDMKLKVKKTDIYIKPDIKEYSVISFSEGSKIIESGKQATIAKMDALKKLTDKNSSEIKSKINSKAKDSIIINNIVIKGNKQYTRAYILGKLRLKTNEKISYDYFNSGINNLIATNNFDSFEYKLKNSENKEGYNLTANLVETKITSFLKLGLHFDDLYKSAALVNLTKKRWLFDNDVASLDIILGDNVRYNLEYFIDKGFYWSIGLKSRYNQFNKDINAKLLLDDAQISGSGLNKIDAKLQDQTNQIYLQTLFRKDFALSAGLEHKRLEVKTETLATNNETNEFVFESTDYLSVFGGLKLDTYDNKYFPKKGVYFNGDLHMYLFASSFNESFDNFSIAKANMGYAFSVSNKLAFNLQTGGGFKIGDKSTRTLDFALGGNGYNLINNFIPFVGYDFISLTGNSFVKASLTADYQIFKKHHITLEGNWANVEDNIFETGEWFTLPDYRGYALGYAIETFVGPIQAKYSYSPEQGRSYWFFNVGFWY
ncbi:NTE family protein RssA [Mariniflexile rhizosphaerae]|uniref:patatin-like phospholipase family protein n=1 Tax=unclassified Mariniflexile TaxID=2643887 RepID=UPI000CB91905|nr:patatin-like phospholipase family protein [Mariniflexile sp. TRM1-10]AXP80375.1 NTE family protein RssA [Mariniflexile sp. TRM1-10]PLB20607.1 MAG: putative patatin-like phospholipase [Flavobacteriaceae bacterium FS1-H7996/R]